jgi:uncharacterized protein YkwD
MTKRPPLIVAAITLLLTVAGVLVPGARGEGQPGLPELQPVAVQGQPLPALETGLLAAINNFRGRRGLRPLLRSNGLRAAAAHHSYNMVRIGFFDHASPNGAPFWRRIQRHYPARGFRRWSVGENILYGSPSLSVAEALSEWVNSPPHRANLVSRTWREAGVSAVFSVPAPGVFDNLPTTVVTLDFGVRRR